MKIDYNINIKQSDHNMKYSRDHPFMNLLLTVVVSLLGCAFTQGDCGGSLSSSSGTIQSPDYPQPYPVGKKCTWFVSVEGPVENIKVSFSAFNLQPKSADGQCMDYVVIYSLLLDKDAGVEEEGRYCGDSIPNSMKITESSITVQFISDSGLESSSSYTGFSLHYETNFDDSMSGKVSQATAGIVAAIFCAVVFIGVGVLRCIMMGACGNPCHVGETRERHVVGTSESNAYQGDFPPSYSTVMHHPERFPTPESSPLFVHSNGTVAGGPSTSSQNGPERTFTLESSSESSDDDETTPPPPYPGNVDSEEQVGVDTASNELNTINDILNVDDLGVDINERRPEEAPGISEVPSIAMILEDELVPPMTGVVDAQLDTASVEPMLIPVIRDNTRDRELFELSGAVVSRDDTEEVII